MHVKPLSFERAFPGQLLFTLMALYLLSGKQLTAMPNL
jgi:hypothetical protein